MKMNTIGQLYRAIQIKAFIAGIMMVLAAAAIAAAESENLALYRPATASSVGHFPTAAEFAVDGQADTGWRSARALSEGSGDWLSVDLQGVCKIDGVKLTWASRADRPVFEEVRTSGLAGGDQVASYGLAYSILLSANGQDWKAVYAATQGAGGTEIIHLEPAEARYVQVAIGQRSHPKCGVGINELVVTGTCGALRPEAVGWPVRRKPKAAPVPAPIPAEGSVADLIAGWELIREQDAGLKAVQITSPELDSSAWYNAVVPGTVLTTLVEQEVFPDPAIGLNNLRIPDSLCRHVWWYRTELAMPAPWLSDGQRIWLELDGVNHSAEVWLNAKRLGAVKGAFMRGRFDITQALNKNGRNILAVRIIPPAHPGIPIEKNDQDWVYNGGALGTDCPTFAATIGWDWLPPIRDRGIGLWGPVRLRRTGGIVIGDPQVVTDLPLPDTTQAAVSITVPVRNTADRPQTVEVSAAFEGVSVSQNLDVPANGVASASFTPAAHPALNLKNPKLWWPAGYGDQPLYDLTLTAKANGAVSDTHQSRFGVREFSYRGTQLFPLRPEVVDFAPVQARYVRVLCLERGTKYGFSLYSVSVLDTRAPDKDLARAAALTASSIESDEHPAAHAADGDPATRWASKSGQPEWLCLDLGADCTVDQVRLTWEAAYAKRYTIQVSADAADWKDVKECQFAGLPAELELSVNGHRVLCRGGNWGYPELLLRLSTERIDAAVRLHRQANLNMIRNWVGMNTCKAFYDACDKYGILIWNDFWLANPSDGPDPADPRLFMDNVRDAILRYRNHASIALWCGRNEGMPPAELDDGMRELTASLDGTRFYQSHSSSRGVNGGGPYKYQPVEGYFKELNRGFKTEMGMPSVPSAESMRRMLGDDNPWPIDIRWTYHDLAPKGAQSRGEYIKAIEDTYGPAAGLDDFCRKAQLINYNGYRAIFEGANHKIWNDCSGVLLWMSHPAWPSTVWQIYDYWFGTDGSFYGSQKANEPLHIQFCPVSDTVELINHTAAPVEGTASAQLLGLDAAVLWQNESALTAAPNTRTDGFILQRPADLPPAYLLVLRWTAKDGRLISENVYWLGSDLKILESMPKAKLTATVALAPGAATVTVSNDGPAIAFLTQLTLRDAASGRRILPAFCSDNYFTLLPGGSKTVTIEYPAADPAKPMKLSLDGWNIEPSEIK
jgi:hypothetical protein